MVILDTIINQPQTSLKGPRPWSLTLMVLAILQALDSLGALITADGPVRVPPRFTVVYYIERVKQSIEEMDDVYIIYIYQKFQRISDK